MKTNSPNVLFNHQANLLLGKTSQVMKQKLLLIVIMVCFCSGAFAQRSSNAQSEPIVITEMNSIFSSGGSSTTARASGAGGMNVSRLRDLITQVQSSTYYFEGIVKTYGGDAPTNLYTDLRSLNQVNSAISAKQNIEIATITINSANELNSIDLTAFSNFPNLKYIYFISNINTTSNNIASHIVNYDSRFNILYKIDKGDRNQ